LKYFDYFFVLRPTLFFPVWTVFLANHHANLCFDRSASSVVKIDNPFFVGILLTLLMGSTFIINQLKDILTDQKNNKLFIIANGYIKEKGAIIEAIILAVVSSGLAFYITVKIGISFLAIFFVTAILYNLKPFAWKDKPILGIIANFLGGITVAAAGWITAGTDNFSFLLHALPYGLGLVAVYFLTTLADISGDAAAGKLTFGVKYGYNRSVYFALAFETITIMLSLWLRDYILFIPALLSFPFFMIAAFSLKLEDVLKAIKYTVLFASLMVCVKYPLYFLVILFIFFFSKWYYRKRFNLEYPKFAA